MIKIDELYEYTDKNLNKIAFEMFEELSHIAYNDAKSFLGVLSLDLQRWLNAFNKKKLSEQELISSILSATYSGSIAGLRKERVSLAKIEVFRQAILNSVILGLSQLGILIL